MPQIAIFASGAGSNAKKIIEYLKEKSNSRVRVGLIVCNKPDAEVLNVANQEKIPSIVIEKRKILPRQWICRRAAISKY